MISDVLEINEDNIYPIIRMSKISSWFVLLPEKIRNFLSDNGINSEVKNLTNTYFQSSYESLLKA